MSGSDPVAGRPLFFCVTGIDDFIFFCSTRMAGRTEAPTSNPALTINMELAMSQAVQSSTTRRSFLAMAPVGLAMAGTILPTSHALADPFLTLLAERRRIERAGDEAGDEEDDVGSSRLHQIDVEMIASPPTTKEGAIAALGLALSEFRDYHAMEESVGDQLLLALIESARGFFSGAPSPLLTA
jgi:hypothetical protein